MKIMTILGTRPEIIRLCRIVEKLDQICDHVLVHTGQNFDKNLNDIFFDELKVRKPNHSFSSAASTFGRQIGNIIAASEDLMLELKPDRLLVLGDTNSGLAVIPAKRLGIPVFHMEAGNRCFDDRVPEEVNRRIIDHTSDILLPYTEGSRANLLREGIESKRIFVTGNPILEVLKHYENDIARSEILTTLGLEKGKFFLVTVHRAENVDVEDRLRSITGALNNLSEQYNLPVIVSTHPRTKSKLEQFNISLHEKVRYLEPFGFFDFVKLEKSSSCTLSDSGTVQEECCILQVPNVTMRDTTERPETLESGSNIVCGVQTESIGRAVKVALMRQGRWSSPVGYLAESVSDTVVNTLISHFNFT
jgi:UDP-N-acetylglucosamine 2-epimerase (non-hydrolysing)